MSYKPFTESEIAILRAFPDAPIASLEGRLPDRDRYAIWHKLRRMGLRKVSYVRKMTEEDQILAIEEFLRSASYKKSAEALPHLCEETVRRFLIKQGLRNAGRSFSRSCRTDIPCYTEVYPDDEQFLGYIIGFIAADGCIKGRRICIDLALKDREFLQKISDRLVLERPSLKLAHKGRSILFAATLPRLVTTLREIGISEKKSLVIDVDFSNRSPSFKRSFLRGLIDGDGSIHIGRTAGENKLRIITASRALAETLKSEFGGTIVIRPARKKEWFDLYCWGFSGRKATILAHILPDLEYSLDRKTEKINLLRESRFHGERRV